ncbi:hypothetical protein KHQ89_05965 [Mycoplasmatota bacterium]|nr:hypothetical protein KHQ89_05965 [Mycoplasmatota bacterium]
MKKFSLVFVLLVLSIFMVACGDIDTVVEKIDIPGLTGEGTIVDPFTLEMALDETISSEIEVTGDDVSFKFDYVKMVGESFEVLGAEDTTGIQILSSSDNSKLDIKAVALGTYYVRVAPVDVDLEIFVKVVVAEETTVDMMESINFPLLTGSGTLEDPFIAEVSYTQTLDFSFSVSPQKTSNKAITWSLMKKVDDTLVDLESTDTKVIDLVSSSVTKISVEALAETGTGYIKGEAQDGSGTVVYIEVSILEFTPVESIATDVLLVGTETDYIMKTAVGTQWDMLEEELARKDGLIAGTAGPGAGQAVEDMTYWPSLYNLSFTTLPETASNDMLLFEYSVEGIVTFNADGSYEALSAGTTVVTVKSFTNPEVSITIEVVVEDSLYAGILASDFENLDVSDRSDWNFDDNPDNLATRPLLLEWQVVQMQTNSVRGENSDDGNQKIFYLGTADRVYGIDLESRVNEGFGDINKTTALVWNKVAIGAEATTMEAVIGNNDKVHNQFRIVMVTSDKTVYVLQD